MESSMRCLLCPSSTGTFPCTRHTVPHQWVHVPNLATTQLHINCTGTVHFISAALTKDGHGGNLVQQHAIRWLFPG